MPQGLKRHPPGSKEKFWLLWATRRGMIQAIHDPVIHRQRGHYALGDEAQRLQNLIMVGLEQDIQYAWDSELGRLWQWADRVDKGLLVDQLADLALIQADDCRAGSRKWEAMEGVMNMLGGLRDWLDGRGGKGKKK